MNMKMELISSFELMNLTLEEKVLRKCEELCKAYDIEPEDFVNIWCAFAAQTLCSDNPTVEKLEQIERKQLQRYAKEKSMNRSPLGSPKKNVPEQKVSSAVMDEISLPQIKDDHIKESIDPQMEITSDITNEEEILDESIARHLSSSNQDASKYTERTNSLSVIASVGKEPSIPINNNKKVYVKLQDEENSLKPDAKYMYEVLGRRVNCLNSMTNLIGTSIAKRNNLPILTDILVKGYIGHIITYGKIFVDGKGHLNLQSIMLEGTQQLNGGHSVILNVDKVPKVALFPGQVVLVKGKMLSGNKLIAEYIYTDDSLDLPLDPPVVQDPLRIIVAAGPYTLNADLNYDPMRDLLNYVVDKEPHVLILMGPFLDENHPTISLGDLTETFDQFFETLVESVSAALQDMNITIIVIASSKDAHHHNVYPTHPYKTAGTYQNVKFYPDPCVLNVDGLVLGATTADVMFHIAKEELVTAKDSDTMSRLPSHIIQQHSFYPLHPPSKEISLSIEFLESYGLMDCLPHLLILPSAFKGFIRNIKECVVVNPERLTRGNGGGAFADITILPGTTQSITNRLSCKILNI